MLFNFGRIVEIVGHIYCQAQPQLQVSLAGLAGAIRSDRYRALVRDMQKLFFIFLFLFKKAFACPLPLGRGV